MTEGDTYLPGDDFYADIADPDFYDPAAAISFYVQDYVDASGATISGGGVDVETGNIPHQGNELQIANAVLEIMPNVDSGYTSPGGDGYYDPTLDPNYDPTMGGSTGGGVGSLSMIVRENGGEVSLSVNNVAPMHAANFAELDGQNIGGALVNIKPAPEHPGRFQPRRQRRGL